MANVETTERQRVVKVVERIGSCLELVPIDPNFHDISVGLYAKDGTMTVWTFSRRPGVEGRIRQIRDQLVALGGLVPVGETHNQVRSSCGQIHRRPLRFLMALAVEKDPTYSPPEGGVKDLRSPLMLWVESSETDGRWAYRVTAEGEAPNRPARLNAVTRGLVRYGDMEKVGDDTTAFTCGHEHDALVRLILPHARNVTGVEDTLAADALRGQMTTGTLGFTPPT